MLYVSDLLVLLMVFDYDFSIKLHLFLFLVQYHAVGTTAIITLEVMDNPYARCKVSHNSRLLGYFFPYHGHWYESISRERNITVFINKHENIILTLSNIDIPDAGVYNMTTMRYGYVIDKMLLVVIGKLL